MKVTTQMVYDKMENLVLLMENMNTNLCQKIENIETKFNDLQSQIQSMPQNYNSSQNNSGNHSFTKIENKEEYLNLYKPCVSFQHGLMQFIYEKSFERHNDSDMFSVLYKNTSLINYIIEIIISILENECNENMNFLYCFEFQKNIIYIWNDKDNSGWEKVSTEKLKKLFETVQKSLIDYFTTYLKSLKEKSNGNFNKVIEIMELSENIYCDDFQKNLRTFKKNLFDRICEINR